MTTLAALVDRMCTESRRRLHKAIDIRTALAHAKDTRSTIHRRYGQLYKKGTK